MHWKVKLIAHYFGFLDDVLNVSFSGHDFIMKPEFIEHIHALLVYLVQISPILIESGIHLFVVSAQLFSHPLYVAYVHLEITLLLLKVILDLTLWLYDSCVTFTSHSGQSIEFLPHVLHLRNHTLTYILDITNVFGLALYFCFELGKLKLIVGLSLLANAFIIRYSV